MVDEVVGRLGPVGILVNNAGVSVPAPIDGDDFEAAWDVTLAVNLTGYVRMVRACLPHLLAAGDGRIVNIAVDRRPRCDAVHLALHRFETWRCRPDPFARDRARRRGGSR